MSPPAMPLEEVGAVLAPSAPRTLARVIEGRLGDSFAMRSAASGSGHELTS